jgi:hypothetical protein
MPGSIQLAHLRNPRRDVGAARAAGDAAAAVVRPKLGSRAPIHNVERLNAYVRGFRLEMQRQYDAHACLPHCGDAEQLLRSFFFCPYDCSAMSQAAFVSWQVKVALGLVPPGPPAPPAVDWRW